MAYTREGTFCRRGGGSEIDRGGCRREMRRIFPQNQKRDDIQRAHHLYFTGRAGLSLSLSQHPVCMMDSCGPITIHSLMGFAGDAVF